jgi:hypothetical protein
VVLLYDKALETSSAVRRKKIFKKLHVDYERTTGPQNPGCDYVKKNSQKNPPS